MARKRRKTKSRPKRSRTHVFDLTGVPVKELQTTPLGRRIVALAKRGKPKDIALIEDVLLDRFTGES